LVGGSGSPGPTIYNKGIRNSIDTTFNMKLACSTLINLYVHFLAMMDYFFLNQDKIIAIIVLVIFSLLTRASVGIHQQNWIKTFSGIMTIILLPIITFAITSVISKKKKKLTTHSLMIIINKPCLYT